MKYSQETKKQIIKLRMDGLTYSEISQSLYLELPKSSIATICRDLILSNEAIEILKSKNANNTNRNRQKALEKNQLLLKLRFAKIKNSAEKVVTKNATEKIALAMLYLGEGSKRHSYRGLSLGSSDPKIIKLFMTLLIKNYDKKTENFKFRILHRADQDIKSLETFWANELGCKFDQFYKTTYDKRTINKPTKKINYKGVCVASTSGADIQLELAYIAEAFLKAHM